MFPWLRFSGKRKSYHCSQLLLMPFKASSHPQMLFRDAVHFLISWLYKHALPVYCSKVAWRMSNKWMRKRQLKGIEQHCYQISRLILLLFSSVYTNTVQRPTSIKQYADCCFLSFFLMHSLSPIVFWVFFSCYMSTLLPLLLSFWIIFCSSTLYPPLLCYIPFLPFTSFSFLFVLKSPRLHFYG